MKRKTVINALLTCCVACGLLSCTDMDEYKKISGDKEIVYPGKIQDVTVYSGDSRLVVEGLCNSDPKVTNCRICWNLDADYVDVPVDMSGGSYWLKKEIALPENSYNFNIYTYDAEGNRSIPVSVTGKSYGVQYKAAISNRLVKSFSVQNGRPVIEWWEIDTTLGAFATEVVYTDNQGAEVKMQVPVEEMSTVLDGYDMTSEVEYTTLYKPDALCVDEFRSVTGNLLLE